MLKPSAMLNHGGNLLKAVREYGRPKEHWLDLSTGINPSTYPIPPVPTTIWNRLPEQEDGLESVARDYYGTGALLPVAGSQAAIQALPQLRPNCRIGIPAQGYAEHQAAWQGAGHHLVKLHPDEIEAALPELDVLLLINPNNPTGQHFNPETLLAWHQQIERRGGWLIVDEAFMDCTPELSLARFSPRPGLIVLRSVGKFFGLAGLRAGFILAEQSLLTQLESQLGPWTLSGPSRWVCRHALMDTPWQRSNREQLINEGRRLEQLLATYFTAPSTGTPLFRTQSVEGAKTLFQALAKQGILVRLFTNENLLRFGLPKKQQDWSRLEQALSTLSLIEDTSDDR